MAVPFSTIKESVLLILYDYMLTSDHEGFWFSVPSIQEALSAEVSGAFTQRALDALIAEKMIEQGGSDVLKKDLFALTEHGIKAAEDLLEERGLKIEEYEPAPDSDQILSRIHHPDEHAAVVDGLSELRKEIGKSNSFEAILAGSGDLVEAELSAASRLVSAERFRVSRLKSLILPTLRYLTKKFADQTIGDVAKRLVALLLGLDA